MTDQKTNDDVIPHRSHSQFSAYSQCGERFRLMKIVRPRPPERPAAWLAHGNAFHETYQLWELSDRVIDFVETYSEIYDRIISEQKVIQPDLNLWLKPFRVRKVLEHIETQKAKGLEQINTFLEMLAQPGWDPWIHEESMTPGVEIPFEIQLGKVLVVGSIDFVREHLEGVSVLDFKGLALDTPLPTPEGWTTMKDVQVGQSLIGRDGQSCTVIHKSDIKSKPCYRVSFDDQSSIVCDDEHLWLVESGYGSHKKMQVLPVQEIKASLRQPWDNQAQYRVPVTSPIDLPEVDLPIHPYVLGVWLGDGRARGGEITSSDEEVFSLIEDKGYRLGADISGPNRTSAKTVYGIRGSLISLDLQNNKHIPSVYLRGSIEQRLDLLRGLMDSDGYWNRARKQAVFTNCNERLSKGVLELALSLGMRAKLLPARRSGFGRKAISYDVVFTPNNGLNPFALKRKAELVQDLSQNAGKYRVITSIDEVESVPTQCVGVSSGDNTYLCGREMIPTHNTGNRVEAITQLGLYALVLGEQYDLEITHGEYFYSKDCTLSKPYDLSRYTREYLTEIYESLDRGVENQVFLPNPGDHCGLCPVADFCRERGNNPIPLDFDSVVDPWWGVRVDEHE